MSRVRQETSTTASSPTSTLWSRIYKFLNKKDNYAEEPPDGGLTAWLQVLACFFIFMNNFGLASAFSVYQAYYQKFMFPDHSASAISWVGTLQASLTLIVGILSGPLFDKGHFFVTVVIASFGLVFSFMMLSICKEYWQVVLCQGLLGGVCTGMLYIPSISLIPLYFSTRRGLAIGLVLSGASVGGVIYPLIFRYALASLGFGYATRVIGFVAIGLLIISIILIKPLRIPNRPEKLRDPTIFKDPYYVSFLFAGFLLFSGLMIPYFDCGTFWFAKFNDDIDSAFYTLVIINASNFFGRVILPTLTDYGVGTEHLINLCTVALTTLGFGWIGVKTKGAYYVFLVLWGFFSAGIACLPACQLPYMVPRPEVFATRLGLVYAAAGLGVLIGAPVANVLDKSPTDFLGAQLWTGVTAAIALLATAHSGYGAGKKRKRIQKEQRARKEALRLEPSLQEGV